MSKKEEKVSDSAAAENEQSSSLITPLLSCAPSQVPWTCTEGRPLAGDENGNLDPCPSADFCPYHV